jgi:ABC-type histidine transport system ATPase subunit
MVVVHEMDFARQVSDEVVFLEKGLLIEKASPESSLLTRTQTACGFCNPAANFLHQPR